ncbi:MAG: LysR family transcriptional regulator [Rhizobiaceae bacterium]
MEMIELSDEGQDNGQQERSLVDQITLHKLRVFCVVAKFSNVTRASESLRIAQPAVTAHLRGLEEKLNVKLVRRVGRNIELTEAGEHVYSWAGNVLARSSDLLRDISGIEEGEIGRAYLASSMVVGTYVLPHILIAFRKKYAGAWTSTSISNPFLATEAVRSGDCDFGVTLLDPNQDTSDLVIELLWKEPLHLVAARHSKLVGKTASIKELDTFPYITPIHGQIARDQIDEALRNLGVVRTQSIMEFGHPESILQAVKADIGVSFVFQSALRNVLERGELRRVKTPGLEISIPLFLIYNKNKHFSKLQIRLMDDIRSAFEVIQNSGEVTVAK